MGLKLSGKKVLVTGSSRGIGRAIAEAFQKEGCIVAINSRNEDLLKSTAQKIGCRAAILGDMSYDKEAKRVVAESVEALNGLDILVCNVGSGQSVSPGNETHDEWHRIFGLNLWSAISAVEAARKNLAVQGGTIICISSICGLEVIPNAPITYSVAKAALHAYIRGIARPLGKQGIRINAIAAGNILFDGSVWDNKITENPDEVNRMLGRDVALAKMGSPEDVAQLTVFLASKQSEFATGSVWALDGGQLRS